MAASQWFEVRPTLAYDAEGRIWVAYEESYRRWGKDFGAYETTGVGIYQGNTVRIKALEGDRYYGLASPLEKPLGVLPASHPPARRPETGGVDLSTRPVAGNKQSAKPDSLLQQQGAQVIPAAGGDPGRQGVSGIQERHGQHLEAGGNLLVGKRRLV